MSNINIGEFFIRQIGPLTVIQLIGDLHQANYDQFRVDLVSLIENPRPVVVDCFLLSDPGNKWFATIGILSQQIMAKDKDLRIVYVSPGVLEKIKKDIADQKIIKANVSDALDDFERPFNIRETFNLIKSLHMATVKNFFCQMNALCERKKSHFKDPKKESFMAAYAAAASILFQKNFICIVLSLSQGIVSFLQKDKIEQSLEEVIPKFLEGIFKNALEIIKESQRDAALQQNIYWTKPEVPALDFFSFDFKQTTAFIIPYTCDHGDFFMELYFPAELTNNDIASLLSA